MSLSIEKQKEIDVGDSSSCDSSSEIITICICTYRRPSIEEAIESASKQAGICNKEIRFVIADNDEYPTAKLLVESTGRRLGIDLRYLHAPARNISIARNAVLDAVESKWAFLIDDDEYASIDWLASSLRSRGSYNAVIGQSIAIYQDHAPDWVKRCDFHSNRIVGRADNAYTSNALIDMGFVRKHNLRFREEDGLTGGEDTLFFRAMAAAGGRIVYCSESMVYEKVSVDRANMRWVLRRKFRSGQTHGLMLSIFDKSAYSRLIFTAGAKAVVCAVVTAFLFPFRYSWRLWAARAVLHMGAISFRLNHGVLQEYSNSKSLEKKG